MFSHLISISYWTVGCGLERSSYSFKSFAVGSFPAVGTNEKWKRKNKQISLQCFGFLRTWIRLPFVEDPLQHGLVIFEVFHFSLVQFVARFDAANFMLSRGVGHLHGAFLVQRRSGGHHRQSGPVNDNGGNRWLMLSWIGFQVLINLKFSKPINWVTEESIN